MSRYHSQRSQWGHIEGHLHTTAMTSSFFISRLWRVWFTVPWKHVWPPGVALNHWLWGHRVSWPTESMIFLSPWRRRRPDCNVMSCDVSAEKQTELRFRSRLQSVLNRPHLDTLSYIYCQIPSTPCPPVLRLLFIELLFYSEHIFSCSCWSQSQTLEKNQNISHQSSEIWLSLIDWFNWCYQLACG